MATASETNATGFEKAKFRVEPVPMDQIRVGKYSLRDADRNTEEYQRLRDSIAASNGPMVSIVVREIDDPENPGKTAFGLIDGLQRFSCCQDLGFTQIPARVIDMDDADVAAAQIIANKSRIETKPAEYSKQLHRMLNANPTMTLEELSEQLYQSVKWLKDRLSLANLHEKIAKLVDDGAVPLAHAFALAKLRPAEHQLEFIEQAMHQNIAEFNGQVGNRIKALRDAARTGREVNTNEFTPTPHMRPLKDIKAQYEQPEVADAVCNELGAQTAADGFRAALAWALHMDPLSVEKKRQEHEDRKAADAARKAKLAEEKAQKKLEEARKVTEGVVAE